MRRNIHIRATCSSFFFSFIISIWFFLFFHLLRCTESRVCAACMPSLQVRNKDCHTQGEHTAVHTRANEFLEMKTIKIKNISSHICCGRARERASERARSKLISHPAIFLAVVLPFCARIFNSVERGARGELHNFHLFFFLLVFV